MQLLAGYAFLLGGVIELYEATLKPGHLDFAIALADGMLARFHDSALGGFWQSAAGASGLILRLKEDYDGAEPSGNSVATLALLKLGKITDRQDSPRRRKKRCASFPNVWRTLPKACPACCKHWISPWTNPGGW